MYHLLISIDMDYIKNVYGNNNIESTMKNAVYSRSIWLVCFPFLRREERSIYE